MFHYPELGLEGQLTWEDLGAQWEHNLHELSPHVKKCDGAESATKRLKDIGIPQVITIYFVHTLPSTLVLLESGESSSP